jgi:hypothetical protein
VGSAFIRRNSASELNILLIVFDTPNQLLVSVVTENDELPWKHGRKLSYFYVHVKAVCTVPL